MSNINSERMKQRTVYNVLSLSHCVLVSRESGARVRIFSHRLRTDYFWLSQYIIRERKRQGGRNGAPCPDILPKNHRLNWTQKKKYLRFFYSCRKIESFLTAFCNPIIRQRGGKKLDPETLFKIMCPSPKMKLSPADREWCHRVHHCSP